MPKRNEPGEGVAGQDDGVLFFFTPEWKAGTGTAVPSRVDVLVYFEQIRRTEARAMC